ncbi:MAG TPA: UDP-N-acetylmuramate dehydrogenase [Longilinea sp.]|nr:UDP-N-acetylmuramate dehydrogenase [Longilinea sp.]
MMNTGNSNLRAIKDAFGSRVQENVRLANYTTAHVGGPADGFLVVNDAQELEKAVRIVWDNHIPYAILGSGSNVLISDQGLRGLVIHNRAHTIKVHAVDGEPYVWAESGANFGLIARQIALRGLSGLEWAATIPGSVGGAVYGNAGAHGSDTASNLILAEILHLMNGKVKWTPEQLGYGYRTSILKREKTPAVILTAEFRLTPSTPEAVKEKMDEFNTRRRNTQPPGASMGSMFKNPPGDHAGRLIEDAGLKGTRIGGVEISSMHANFFVNHADATAQDIYNLIDLARKKVAEKSGVELELEIELLGEWSSGDHSTENRYR